MKRIMQRVFLVLSLTLVCCQSIFGAEFRLKNGDVVTGDLMSYDGIAFQVKSTFGTISIDVADLAVVGLNAEEGVVDIVIGLPRVENRDRIRGEIESIIEDEVKIKTAYGYVVVNSLDQATGIFLSEAETKTSDIEEKGQLTLDQQVLEAKGFMFTLQECKKAGESLSCHFLITSREQDRKFVIYRDWNNARSRVFDDTGNEYWARAVHLASESRESSVGNILIAGVPTKASLTFEGIAPDAELISLLELGCYDDDDSFSVQFRNVQFSQ